MAFGSGSSLATDRWMRRGGLSFSAQAFKVGNATLLHQHSSEKPTATRDRLGRLPSVGRAFFFSFVQRIGGSDPALRPHPAHRKQARERCPDRLPRDSTLGQSLLEGDIGGHIQSPKARLLPELPRGAVEHLPQG